MNDPLQPSSHPAPTAGEVAEHGSAAARTSLLSGIAAAVPDWETRLLRAATRDSLSQVTLGMAHELNNLIGGISALSEIYLQGIESGLPLKDGLGLIHHSASRLQALLRQLTGINRHPEGTRDYVNLAEMIRGELALFTHVLPKSVRLDTNLPDEELAALIDETALEQVLLNLVLNLRDALGGDRAAGTLKIMAARLPGDPARAEMRFSSSPPDGRTMPPEPAPPDALWLDAQVRLLDARQTVEQFGGHFDLRDGALVLTIPLIA